MFNKIELVNEKNTDHRNRHSQEDPLGEIYE